MYTSKKEDTYLVGIKTYLHQMMYTRKEEKQLVLSDYSEFSAYGRVLRSSTDVNTELYRSEEPTGWKLAELPVTDRTIVSMSLHDNTPEAFIPLEGTAVLKVATKSDFSDCKTFLIDRPLVINASVWHGLASPGADARLLLVESKDVNLIKKPIKED